MSFSIYRTINKFKEIIKALKVQFTKTDYGRWKFVDKETHFWDERNKIIAKMIPNGSSVLDLGAGSQTLRNYLQNCHYQPVDFYKKTPDTLICDFNNGEFPSLMNKFDYVVCSGLFEYIRDPLAFLGFFCGLGSKIILTYALRLPHQSKISRLNQGWVNHLTQDELEKLFLQLDLHWTVVNRWNNQNIYMLIAKSLSEN